MKNKIILTSLTVILGFVMNVTNTFAATTASITPSTVSVANGQSFNVVVSVNPSGTKNYAEKLEVNYPADLLQVSAFNLGSNWIPLTQTGYDSIDNTNGILIKTGGYTSGITTLTPFGTITFVAKKSGTGTITIGNNSQAFEVSSQTPITGSGSKFTISTAKVIQKVNNSPSTSTTIDLTPVTTINGQVVPTTTSQAAAAAVAVSGVTQTVTQSNNTWIWILVVVVLIIVIFLLIRRKKK